MKNSNDPSCPKCGAAIPAEAPQGLCPKCVLEGAATFPDASTSRKGRPEPPSVESVAAAFPDLEVTELIGAGGMGSVYKARQSRLDRTVALKILSLDLASDPAFAERFNREARMLGLLNHPNIVAIYDFGKQADYYYLLMEYVDGVNLRQAMQAGSFSPDEALSVVPEICAALQYAHDEGVMHRDIKPENILIDTRGRVKIADFGIAKLMGDKQEEVNLTVSGAVMGTLNYMAPEQMESSGEVDHRADIYSLGVVFYEMLTGELPIGRFERPSEKASMDARVDDVVLRTLENKRERRYQSAGEVKTNVEAIASSPGGADGQTAESGGRAAENASAARGATWSAALTCVSLLFSFLPLAVVFYWLSRSEQTGSGINFIFIAPALLSVVPGVIGFVLGVRALREIRTSGGALRGLTRSMFGALAWPLIVVLALTGGAAGMGFAAMFGPGLLWLLAAALVTVAVGESCVIAVWRWAKAIPWRGWGAGFWSADQKTMAMITAAFLLIPTLGILVPLGFFTLTRSAEGERSQSPEKSVAEARYDGWFHGRPAIDLAMTVPAGQVATFALIRNDGFKTIEVLNLQGYLIASDDKPWAGRVQLGATGETPANGRQPWTIRIVSVKGPIIGAAGGDLRGEWDFDVKDEPVKLDLNAKSLHMVTVASPSRAAADDPAVTETLSVQVISRPRAGAGIPEIAMQGATVGGGSTNWLKTLKEWPDR